MLRDSDVVKFIALRATSRGLQIRRSGCHDLGAVVDCLSAAIRSKEPRGFEIPHLLVARKAINFTISPPRSVRIVLVVADWLL